MFRLANTPVSFCLLALTLIVSAAAGREARAQGLRISDADVNLNNLEALREPEADSGKQASPAPATPAGGARRQRVAGATMPLDVVAGRAGTAGDGAKLISFTGYSKGRLEAAVYREAARYNIDPMLIFALIEQESGGRLGAVSHKGARGPMQLMPGTAARFGVRNSHDPDEAVRGGVAYIVWLLDRFGGDVSLALAGYNSGEGAVEAYLTGRRIILRDGKVINPRGIRTGGIPPYAETQNYVRLIASRYRRLRAAARTKAATR